VELADVSFSAALGFSRERRLDRIHLTHRSRVDPRRCRAMHERTVHALEGRYGAFQPSAPVAPPANPLSGRPAPTASEAYASGEVSSVSRVSNPETHVLYHANAGDCLI